MRDWSKRKVIENKEERGWLHMPQCLIFNSNATSFSFLKLTYAFTATTPASFTFSQNASVT
jgi:hypothetical protein